MIQRKVFVIFGSFTLLLTLIYSLTNIMIAFVVEDEVLEKVLAYEALAIFLVIFVIVIILSLWFAYRIATKTTKPILILSREVMQQQSQKAPMIFSAKQNPDEIGYLAHTIDAALSELQHLVKTLIVM